MVIGNYLDYVQFTNQPAEWLLETIQIMYSKDIQFYYYVSVEYKSVVWLKE